MDAAKQPGIAIGQIVLEKVEFEHRADYLAFPPRTEIKGLPVQLNSQLALAADRTKGLLRVRIRTTEEANALYRFDLTMSALIEVKAGEANMSLEQYATVSGVSLLYPFLREAVANVTQRGRFGAVWLAPFNVAAAVQTEQRAPLARPSPAGRGKKR